jgi:hypothetical protein
MVGRNRCIPNLASLERSTMGLLASLKKHPLWIKKQ